MEPGRGFRPAQLQRHQRRALALQRFWAGLKRPRSLLLLLLIADVAVALAVGLWTSSLTLTLLALVPLMLAPALAGLAYWLLWQDFHR